MESYVVFDLETTTNIPTVAEIIEIAALKIVDGCITEEFSTLVKPYSHIKPSASAVNGITNDMVADAPSLQDTLSLFLTFIENHILIGYNIASFDIPILRRVLSEELGITLHNDYSDVLPMARKCLKALPNHKLTTVAEYFNISTTGAHRALKDCYLTKACYEKLLEMSPCESQKKSTHQRYGTPFTEQTKSLQILHGFLLGVVADNILTEPEVNSLKQWLNANQHLSGQYPFDKVFSIVEDALSDGVLEQSELDEMLSLFKKFTSPMEEFSEPTETLDFSEKNICLTGDFKCGSRKKLESILHNLNSNCQSNVSGKTDYVIVGSLGSPSWTQGNYGNKIKKAFELRDRGAHVQILKEEKFIEMMHAQGVSL